MHYSQSADELILKDIFHTEKYFLIDQCLNLVCTQVVIISQRVWK